MTSRGDFDQPRRGPCPQLAAVVLSLAVAVALVLVGAPAVRASPTAGAWPASSLQWNNSVVLCNFDLMTPSVAVSALGVSGSGLSSGISQLTEVSPAGAPVAVASMANASWNVTNASTPDTFDLAYQAHVSLVAASGPPTPLGSAAVRVDYTLAAYADSPSDNLSSVAAVFQVSQWSWQNSGDRLVITLPLWPTFARAEYLSTQSPGGLEVTSSSNATGAPREYFHLAPTATATPVSGAPMSVGVSPSVSLAPSFATITLTVGTQAGSFTSLSYTAHVTVPLPSTLAGLPLYDYPLVAGAAAALSIAVAVGTRRVRQRPSDLKFVEEEP